MSSISGTNLSALLSGTFGSDYSSTASLFNTSSSSSSDSISSLFSDYAAIKNGSYSKLLKAYYSKVESSDSDSDSSTVADKSTATAAQSLYSSLSALSAETVTEENRSDISSEVKEMVEKYNDLIESAGDSDSSTVLQRTLWMTNTTDAYSDLLNDIGITVNSDNTLSFSEDTFATANLTTINDLFDSNSSWLSRTIDKSNTIYAAASASTDTTSGYTAAGQYMKSTSSMLDTLI